jgi:hypothetical protein
MDHFAIRRYLLAEAADLRTQSRAHRHAVDQSVAELDMLTAQSRATLARSWQTLDRVNRSLRDRVARPPPRRRRTR